MNTPKPSNPLNPTEELKLMFPQSLTNKSKQFLDLMINEIAEKQKADRELIDALLTSMQEYMGYCSINLSIDEINEMPHKQFVAIQKGLQYAQAHGYLDEKFHIISSIESIEMKPEKPQT